MGDVGDHIEDETSVVLLRVRMPDNEDLTVRVDMSETRCCNCEKLQRRIAMAVAPRQWVTQGRLSRFQWRQ